MDKPISAYLVPSAIFMGVALHELAASLFFIAVTRQGSIRTAIDYFSMIAWALCAFQTYIHISLINYLISPTAIAQNRIMWTMVAGYISNFLTSSAVLLMIIARLRVFHRSASRTFWILTFGCISTFCVLAPYSAFGVISCLDVIKGNVKEFYESPSLPYLNLLFAGTCLLEGIFTASESVMFLWVISKSTGVSKYQFIRSFLLKYEGFRLFIIFLVNIAVACCTVYFAYIGASALTYTAWFSPPMLYAFEIYTFLLVSFVTPGEVFRSAQSISIESGDSNRKIGWAHQRKLESI
ncbi:hypothetical protein BASA83_007774 [Batrachochytrium salamandrivorans]|nr:hypothetical protein BASA83_007774 [Batrachochytrium salamandrivorans]